MINEYWRMKNAKGNNAPSFAISHMAWISHFAFFNFH